MRKIALGRLRIAPSEFYLMTLAELYDAITGDADYQKHQMQWYLWGIRRAIYFQVNYPNGAKDEMKEEDIIPLDMDEEIKRERIANMIPIKVTKDGIEQ